MRVNSNYIYQTITTGDSSTIELNITSCATELNPCCLGLQTKIELLELEVINLKKQLYGKKSEKRKEEKEKESSTTTEEETKSNKTDETIEVGGYTRKKGGRKPLPDSLPRIQSFYRPEDTNCEHCNSAMSCIGKEVTEVLEHIPASLIVHEHIREKYACRCCKSQVKIGEIPPDITIIDKKITSKA